MSVYRFACRVAYDDINNEQQLTLKGVMGFMQEAAMLASSKCGYGFDEVKSKGVAWLLSQWRIRMTGAAIWDTDLEVETWVKPMERVKSVRDFILKDKQGYTIAIGESVWTLVNVETGHPMKLTEEIAAAYVPLDRSVFENRIPRIVKGEGTLTYQGTVTRRDLDTNHHMNNRVYVDWAREALPEEVKDRDFEELTVHYHRQLLPNQQVQCFYRRQEDAQIVDFYQAEDPHCCATVAFYEKVQNS